MNRKGFTLIELLAVIAILGLLISIGIYALGNITDNAKEKYYESMESTLLIAGNDYFNDNREDRPIDDYNFVSLDTLVNHEYLEPLKLYNSNTQCDPKSGVYIYNTDNGNEYESCLICGDYKTSDGYCEGIKEGQISIKGETASGKYYNPVLSYSGTSWVNEPSVKITYTLMGQDVHANKFIIYDTTTNKEYLKCENVTNNSCSNIYDKSGSYYVIAYNNDNKVGNRKYFNVKIDHVAPTFELKDSTTDFYLDNNDSLYEYHNEVINIHDDNGYSSVTYSLIEIETDNPRVNIVDKDLIDKDLKIIETLPSGKYQLTVKVRDYAGNQTEKSIIFTVWYNVDLVFYDNNNKKHDIGTIHVYKNGKYGFPNPGPDGKENGIPSTVDISGTLKGVYWYDNTNYDGNKYSNGVLVTKDGYHILYGHEERMIPNNGTIDPKTYLKCNNNGDFTYNGSYQELVTAHEGYTVSNNVQMNAGTYIIIARLDKDYMWENGTRTTRIIQCTIKRKKTSFNEESFPCTNFSYLGVPQRIVSIEGVDFNISEGFREVVSPLSIGETEYTSLYDSENWQYFSETPAIYFEGDKGSYDYYASGYSGDFKSYGKKNGVFTVNPFMELNAGKYDVTVTFNDNYLSSDGKPSISKACEIKKYDLSGKTVYITDESRITLSIDYESCGDVSGGDGCKGSGYCEFYTDDVFETTPSVYEPMSCNYEATAIDTASDKYTVSVSGFSFDGSGTWNPESKGLSNYIFPTSVSKNVELKDSTPPVCDSGNSKVDDDGTITFAATDNYKFDDAGNKTATQTKTNTSTGSIEANDVFTDAQGNAQESKCKVTVVKQTKTITCKTGNRCDSAACETRAQCNYCENGSYNKAKKKCCYTETNDDGEEEEVCEDLTYGRGSSCACETRKQDIGKCGCAEWNDDGTWAAAEDNSCTVSEAEDHASKVLCRFAKG